VSASSGVERGVGVEARTRLAMRTSPVFRRGGAKLILYTFLVSSVALLGFPFLWMLSSSLKPLSEIFSSGVLFPQDPTFDNYIRLFTDVGALRKFGNSFIVSIGFTVLSVFLCALGGYGFGKFRFQGREVLFWFVLATLTIPLAAILVPLFVMMRNTFNWIDTLWPLIIPGAANAFGIFFMRQYMQSIPDELIDSARVDGAGEYTIFWRVVLPAAAPGLASLAIIFFMRSWNDFLWPLAVLRSEGVQTIPVMLNAVQGPPGRTAYDLLMAGAVLSVLPLAVVFLLLQRRLVAGVTLGAVKQ
jgi:ABC-type glycerol-3-phosphate transport system permease component